MTGHKPKGARTVYLPDGWNKPVREPPPKRCCARCATPYGHSALAGMCCHDDERND